MIKRLLPLLICLPALHAGRFNCEAQVSCHIPSSSTFREIYGQGALYTLEASYDYKRLSPFVSVSYLGQSGHTETNHIGTRVTMVPLALGLKYRWCWRTVEPYLGLGLAATYLHTHDDSSFVVKRREKWGFGYTVKSGLAFDIGRNLFLDLFANYLWTEMDFRNTHLTRGNDVDCSGFALGVGLGRHF